MVMAYGSKRVGDIRNEPSYRDPSRVLFGLRMDRVIDQLEEDGRRRIEQGLEDVDGAKRKTYKILGLRVVI
ncbi:MAG: hypothetical protein IIA87_00570 [Nanoarchaeota archaeon]|nr:hypothetical protein [Nanoarchaeota archaeon]